ncbi:MAG: hypothetical protein ACREVG_04020 [Burkholderiales bacterium]
MTSRVVFDTSIYIAVLRAATFAAAFRDRYVRAIPRALPSLRYLGARRRDRPARA